MNYRHAYHAGNFADCMKHALLVWLMRAMARKPAGCFVLDTHAGAGRYDLAGKPAQGTGERHGGIDRLRDKPPPALADYVDVARSAGGATGYPGSPALLRALLRQQDRLACCELHSEDAAALRRLFAGDPQVGVHRRDGWEALGALLPPSERRALVLIDPPYERADEFAALAAGLRLGYSRFRGGVFAGWYPIKHRAPVRDFHAAIRAGGTRDVVAAELLLREPLDPGRLNGCGLLVVNPPWQFEEAAGDVLEALLARLGVGDAGERAAVTRLVDE